MSCPRCDPPAGRERAVAAAVPRPLVLLVGNPNVGKSTLFNRLTGARQHVVNAPGTTVEVESGRWRAIDADLIDLPGTYSLLAGSLDETVAADAVLGRADHARADLAVVLLDATAPARSLYLLAQVAEVGCPAVVAVTFADVARRVGSPVDVAALSCRLGAPVVEVDPRTGRGVDDLAHEVTDALRSPPCVRGIEPDGGVRLGIARREGEGRPGPALDALVAHTDALLAWVTEVADAACPAPPTHVRTLSDRVDAVLLRPWVGLPVFLAVMWGLFEISTRVAAPVMAAAASLVVGPLGALVSGVLAALGLAGGWLESFLLDGVLAGVGTVAAFAPLMGLMFLAMAVLEGSGYLARAAFVADRGMRALGLDGRALLPLVVGFGCNLPALAALRTLPNARQRALTALLVPLTSCSARLPVYVLLATALMPGAAGTAIFAMYVLSVVLVVGVGSVLRRTSFRDVRAAPLVLVLPPYQRPRIGTLLASAGHRVLAFVRSAGTILVATLTVMWVLLAVPVSGDHPVGAVPPSDSVLGAVSEAVAPVFGPAGFGSWHASAALVTGFVAKEVVVGSFAQTFAVDEGDGTGTGGLGDALRATFTEASGGHAAAAGLAFMVFVLAYTPCVATLAEQRRLLGGRAVALGVVRQLAAAWLLAVVVFQVGRLL
jgi:ferrous iron transport protein B